jgi:hypothetical protein
MAVGVVGWSWLRRVVASLVLVAMVVGCTATRRVDVAAPESLADQVQADDQVRIVTVDGRVLTFEVTQVEPDAVVGPGVRVERHEIAELEATRFSPARTAGLVGGTGLTAVGIALIIFIAIAPALILAAAAP